MQELTKTYKMGTTTDAMAKYMVKKYGECGEQYLPHSSFYCEERLLNDEIEMPKTIIIQSKMNNMATVLDPRKIDHVKEKKVDFYHDIYKKRKWKKLRGYYKEKKKLGHSIEFRPWRISDENKGKITAFGKAAVVTESIAI